jgi:flagellar protein FliS
MSAVLTEYTRTDENGSTLLGKDDVVKMLVEGAIDKMEQAVKAEEDGEMILKGFLLGRTTGIIDGLRNMLDLNFGGEEAYDLDTVYNHIDLCLQAATDHANHAYLLEALDLLQGMAAAWQQMPPLTLAGSINEARL